MRDDGVGTGDRERSMDQLAMIDGEPGEPQHASVHVSEDVRLLESTLDAGGDAEGSELIRGDDAVTGKCELVEIIEVSHPANLP